MVTLLDPATAARDICPVVEDVWYHHLGRFHSLAHSQEILPRQIRLLCLALQRRLRHDTRFQAYARVGPELLLLLLERLALVLGVHCGRVDGRVVARRGDGRGARVCIFICIDAERELALGSYLALLLERGYWRRCPVLCKLALMECPLAVSRTRPPACSHLSCRALSAPVLRRVACESHRGGRGPRFATLVDPLLFRPAL
jgi:hypothetical protein